MNSNNKLILFLFMIIIFIIGCDQEEELVEQEQINDIIEEEIFNEELEKEFDDNLDDALKELEEIEDI